MSCRQKSIIHQLDAYTSGLYLKFNYSKHSGSLHIFVQYVKTGRKEMSYLTRHSTHFIYGYMAEKVAHIRILTRIEEYVACLI